MRIVTLDFCPFCGGTAKAMWGVDDEGFFGFAQCITCRARTGKLHFAPEPDEEVFPRRCRETVAEMWNRRVNWK